MFAIQHPSVCFSLEHIFFIDTVNNVLDCFLKSNSFLQYRMPEQLQQGYTGTDHFCLAHNGTGSRGSGVLQD